MPQIHLAGHIDVPPECHAALSAALPEHIRLTRAEPGCLSFEVMPDDEVAGRWHVAEVFESRAAFNANQARVAASEWGRISAEITRDDEVRERAP